MEQGSKIFRAKELTDYMEYVDAKPKRFDDIEINGELLSQREMWLRKIDKVFGNGMLRRIGELLTMSKLSTGDQFQKLIADLRSKVEEIKNASHKQ